MRLSERIFDTWVQLMLRHRVIWLVAVFLSTLVMAAFASQLPLMTTLHDLLPATTPGMELYEPARERFGGDETAYVAIEADDHFTPEGLARLEKLTKALEDHIFVQRVVSPTNAQQMWVDEEDSLRIDRFVRDDRTPEQIREAMTGDDAFGGTLVSKDGRFVMIVAQSIPSTLAEATRPDVAAEVAKRTADLPPALTALDDPQRPRRLLELSKQPLGFEIVALAEEAGFDGDKVYAVGFTPILAFLLAEAERNLQQLFPITFGVILLALFLLLRRPLDTVLPFLCVGPAVIWALAIGGFVFGRITLIGTVAPVIVLVVGVSDVVHLITQYRHELARGFPRNDAIRLSFAHVGAACTLTSVTTLIGFGSMIFLPLPTAQELGVTAGIGVVAAFLLSFVLTPIFLSYTNPTEKDRQKMATPDGIARVLEGFVRLVRPRPGLVAAAGLLLTAGTIALLLQHSVENSLTRKLKRGHRIRESVKLVEDKLGSSAEIEILIDTGRPDGVKDPAVIQGLAKLRSQVEKVADVRDTISLLDPLERMHRLMAPELAKDNPLPAETPQQIAQYLLLFEVSGGEALDSIMDPTGQHTRMILRGVDGTAEDVIAAAVNYDRWAADALPETTTAAANGIGLLAARLGPAIFDSTVEGFGIALALIAVMLGFLFRSVRVGALSLIPNLFPVAAGLVGIPFMFEQIDVDTLTFIPVCVGIAVDDTIHFLARFRIERRKGLDRADAVSATIREAGHGILRTSLVLIAGFAVLLLADYQPVATVGLLLPVTLFAAVLMDLTLAPAMAQLGWIDAR